MKYAKWVLCFFIILITGCASIGPRQIYLDRNRYNDIIQDTTDQQLLANIVKLRYLEPMSFLKVTNVTASYTLSPFNQNSNNGIIGIESAPTGITRTLAFTPSFSYSDTPTISYIPMEGTEFANSMMEPLRLETLFLLTYGGINDPELIFRLAIQSIGDIHNAPSASGARVKSIPEYQQYYKLLGVLLDPMRDGTCQFRPTKFEDETLISLHCYDPTTEGRIKNILGIPLNTPDPIFTEYPITHMDAHIVYIQPRSVSGIISYLAQGVQIPAADIQNGSVEVLRYPDGTPFDWCPLMNGLWKVYSSDREPCDAYVKVFVHCHWFYIKNTDIDSKATFMFLNRLMTLVAIQNPKSGDAGPTLTIPTR